MSWSLMGVKGLSETSVHKEKNISYYIKLYS